MSPTEIRRAVEALHRDTLTGQGQSVELTGLLGAAVTIAKRDEEQALCFHLEPPVVRPVTNAIGRFVEYLCPTCMARLKLEEVA